MKVQKTISTAKLAKEYRAAMWTHADQAGIFAQLATHDGALAKEAVARLAKAEVFFELAREVSDGDVWTEIERERERAFANGQEYARDMILTYGASVACLKIAALYRSHSGLMDDYKTVRK